MEKIWAHYKLLQYYYSQLLNHIIPAQDGDEVQMSEAPTSDALMTVGDEGNDTKASIN